MNGPDLTVLHAPPGVRAGFVITGGHTVIAVDAIAAMQIENVGASGDLALVAYYRQHVVINASALGGVVPQAGAVLQIFPASLEDQGDIAKAALSDLIDRVALDRDPGEFAIGDTDTTTEKPE